MRSAVSRYSARVAVRRMQPRRANAMSQKGFWAGLARDLEACRYGLHSTFDEGSSQITSVWGCATASALAARQSAHPSPQPLFDTGAAHSKLE